MAVHITSGGGRRPVVVLFGSLSGLDARLARAGFAAVTFDPETPSALEIVLDVEAIVPWLAKHLA